MNQESDINIELWMAHQAGMNDMYQDRVKSKKAISEFDSNNPAQKSMNFSNTFMPRTMEQDIALREYAAQKSEAAKFGYNPVNPVLDVAQGVNKAFYILSLISVGISALTTSWLPGAGVFVGVVGGGFSIGFYKLIQWWIKAADMAYLVGKADKAELMNIVGEAKKLKTEMDQYDNFAQMPKDLQKKIYQNINKQYVATNKMKDALMKIKH